MQKLNGITLFLKRWLDIFKEVQASGLEERNWLRLVGAMEETSKKVSHSEKSYGPMIFHESR
jgi:hypothetical protein